MSRPDIDNYVKAVSDGLNGVLWLDDSQIVHLTAAKVYRECASLEIEVRESF